jgi:hypothetical protein
MGLFIGDLVVAAHIWAGLYTEVRVCDAKSLLGDAKISQTALLWCEYVAWHWLRFAWPLRSEERRRGGDESARERERAERSE